MKLLILALLLFSTAAQAQHFSINRKITTSSIPNSPVASLPACNASRNGDISNVTDATTPAVGATVVGGGAVITLVHCNGSNWLVG